MFSKASSRERVMQKKCAVVVLSLLVIIFGALAAYVDCSQAATHHDLIADHDGPKIHCLDAFLNSSIQFVSTIQSPPRNWSKIKILPTIQENRDSFAPLARFTNHPFREPFSHQGLFRFEKVFRL